MSHLFDMEAQILNKKFMILIHKLSPSKKNNSNFFIKIAKYGKHPLILQSI